MKIPGAWGLFGVKRFDQGVREGVLLVSQDDQPERFVIAALDGNDGGWMYRNGWAATRAFDAWDGNTPPMAGEWQDF